MAVKYSYVMVIKYYNIFHSKVLQILLNWDFEFGKTNHPATLQKTEEWREKSDVSCHSLSFYFLVTSVSLLGSYAFSIPRSSKFYQNWDFWFENKPSGSPGED
jgi:hypothetical protein